MYIQRLRKFQIVQHLQKNARHKCHNIQFLKNNMVMFVNFHENHVFFLSLICLSLYYVYSFLNAFTADLTCANSKRSLEKLFLSKQKEVLVMKPDKNHVRTYSNRSGKKNIETSKSKLISILYYKLIIIFCFTLQQT